jgi:hypothetical protein
MTRDIYGPSRRLLMAGLAATLVPLPRAHAASPDPKLVLRAQPGKAKLFPDATEAAEIWAFDAKLPAR